MIMILSMMKFSMMKFAMMKFSIMNFVQWKHEIKNMKTMKTVKLTAMLKHTFYHSFLTNISKCQSSQIES